MDHQIGRILDALERTGKADDTYIFFTADHGLAVGQHGLVGKQNMYDHSVRVPFIVVGPKVPAGAAVDQLLARVMEMGGDPRALGQLAGAELGAGEAIDPAVPWAEVAVRQHAVGERTAELQEARPCRLNG